MNSEQNVVYFIGAGFSAPFGLPVMSNFIDKARDLYFSDTTKYKELKPTLELIQKYSNVLTSMNVNLFNIEDLLSILSMGFHTDVEQDRIKLDQMESFIKTVIEKYTSDQALHGIVKFSRHISNAKLSQRQQSVATSGQQLPYYIYDGKYQKDINYGVISLNYDRLIEIGLNYWFSKYDEMIKRIDTKKEFDPNCFQIIKSIDDIGLPIAKLHGTVDGDIVPPTWEKTAKNEIRNEWILARQLLENATHLIFLGYSLPITDNYIKYLLAQSFIKNEKLKLISVITLDSDGYTHQRYNNLFGNFRNFMFHNNNIHTFFDLVDHTILKSDYYNYDNFNNDIISIQSKKSSVG